MKAPLLYKDTSEIWTQIAGGDAGGILNCAQALIRNAVLVPARYRAFVDLEPFSQINEAETAVFEEISERHFSLVAQLTTIVNHLGWATL